MSPFTIIGNLVAEEFRLAPSLLQDKTREEPIATARHVAMYLCRTLTDATVNETAQAFRRSIGLVSHATHSILSRISTDRRFAVRVSCLQTACAEALALADKEKRLRWPEIKIRRLCRNTPPRQLTAA